MGNVIPFGAGPTLAQAQATLADIPPDVLREVIEAARPVLGGPEAQALMAQVREILMSLSPANTPEIADELINAFLVVAHAPV